MTNFFFNRSSSLTSAAGLRVRHDVTPQRLGQVDLGKRGDGWQRRILELSEQVPEVAGAGALVRNSVSRVKFVVEAPGADPRRVAHVQAQIDALDKGRLAELHFLTGEAYIVWPDDAEPIVLSIEEFKPGSSGKPAMQMSGLGMDETIQSDWFRVWRPSTRRRNFAGSPHQAALDLIESMYLHQLADSAVATSRLAGAGILVWPTTRKSMPLKNDGSPEMGSQQEMLKEFHQAAYQSIKMRDSRDSVIPFVVFVDPEVENYKPEMLRIEKEDYADEYAVRFDTYRKRYAASIELPIESVTGMGDTNHWSAWAIREDQWRSYLAPTVELQRSALEKRVVRDVVKGLGPSARLVVDASDLVQKPDRSADLLRLIQLGVIDPEYAIGEMGLDPSSAREIPERAYSTQQMEGLPSESTLGGERGGGQMPR